MSARKRATAAGGFVVIGLGRVGRQVAITLTQLGHEVLAIDNDPKVVQSLSHQLTHVVQTDSTDETALRQLGVPDFERVMVALGTAVEASMLTVLALTEIGSLEIWARASSHAHAKMLNAMGVAHVIFPEASMGERIGHLLVSRMIDFVEINDDFALAKTRVPGDMVGKSVAELDLWGRYRVSLIGIQGPEETFTHAGPETVLPPDSILIVEGTIDHVQAFATLS
ncbi:potassium channel family protein [Micromonospora sp. NPDC003197]